MKCEKKKDVRGKFVKLCYYDSNEERIAHGSGMLLFKI